MKKVLSLLLAAALCFSLCACGATQDLNVTDLEKSLEGQSGVLDIEYSGKTIKKFTYIIENVDTQKLSDKNFCEKAFYEVLSGNPTSLTYSDFMSMGVFVSLMSIVNLLYISEEFNAIQYTEELLSIVCDGNTQKYNNWSVSVKMDEVNNSATIVAVWN